MSGVSLSLLFTILHASYYDGPFFLAWSFDPLVTTGLLAASTAYAWAWFRVRESGGAQPPSWYAWAYAAGIFSLAFALLGPLETYNAQLFSLHMAQHMVIMQVSAPLLLLGRPTHLLLRALPPRKTKSTIRFVYKPSRVRYAIIAITGPVLGFLMFSINMGLWHFPQFYEAALNNDLIHHLQHLMFAAFAGVYWWIIIDPIPRHLRLPELWAIGSIFLSMMIGSVIGAILTLANTVLYPFYANVTNPWGWSPLLDQQVGGLIMWAGGFVLYFIPAVVLAVQFVKKDQDTADTAGKPVRSPA